jgi:hypothetical protein
MTVKIIFVNLKFQMEQVLEAIILGGGDHQDVENAILHIILNRGIGQHPNLRFNLNEISNEEAKGNFRFEKQDIPILARLLEIPNLIRTESRNVVEGTTALAILLRRLGPVAPTPVKVNCRLKCFVTLVTNCYNNVFVYFKL